MKSILQASIKYAKELAIGDRILIRNKLRFSYRRITEVNHETDIIHVYLLKMRYSYHPDEEVIVYSKYNRFAINR